MDYLLLLDQQSLPIGSSFSDFYHAQIFLIFSESSYFSLPLMVQLNENITCALTALPHSPLSSLAHYDFEVITKTALPVIEGLFMLTPIGTS